jgi:hypothetical protein
MKYVSILAITLLSLSFSIPITQEWYRSKIVVAVDGRLQKFLINDNEMVLPELPTTWKTPIILSYALFPGDQIKLVMKSTSEMPRSSSETPNFAARIEYNDQRGNTAVFYSDIKTWDCNGDDPKSSGRVGENLSYAHWRINEVGNRAELLWSRESEEATCYFTIPANLITSPLDFKPVQVNEEVTETEEMEEMQ